MKVPLSNSFTRDNWYECGGYFSKLFFYLLFKFLLYLNADWVPWRVLSASHVLTHIISIHMLISGGKDGRLFLTHQPV